VRDFVLVEIGDSEAIDLFLREEDAQAAPRGRAPRRAGLAGTLTVEAVERDVSPN
jgi:hypothetical protein